MRLLSPGSLDTSVPVLLFKVSKYPLSHGTLGAVRSLGRMGVPVHALTESRFIPYAYSRYMTSTFIVEPGDIRGRESLVAKLIAIRRELSGRAVLIATDDEAALLVSEYAKDLRPHFIFPENDAALLSALSSKQGLYRICRKHGVPTPRAVYARTRTQVERLAKKLRYPIVVKNSDPWTRLAGAAVGATTIVASQAELLAMAAEWPANPCVILQDYIPADVAEDWIFHAYCNKDREPVLAFTGLKQRSWPPGAGVTTSAVALPNEALRQCAMGLLRAIGYRGVVDMDWRYDSRDGQYKIVDFNPRLGANFRLFSDNSSIDLVRALHLDLTGRKVPSNEQEFGRRFVVENLDLVSRMVKQPYRNRRSASSTSATEWAWFAADDLLPFLLMIFRFAGMAFHRLIRFRPAFKSRLPAQPTKSSV
jgi:predicted ATP-grasp superfamily ATP-dependent carboligase